jgi:hypothetical protein
MLSKTIFATAILALSTSVLAAPVAQPSTVSDLLSPGSGNSASNLGDLLSPGSSDSALNGNSATGNGNGNSAGNGNAAGNNDGNNDGNGNSLINLSKLFPLCRSRVWDVNDLYRELKRWCEC